MNKLKESVKYGKQPSSLNPHIIGAALTTFPSSPLPTPPPYTHICRKGDQIADRIRKGNKLKEKFQIQPRYKG